MRYYMDCHYCGWVFVQTLFHGSESACVLAYRQEAEALTPLEESLQQDLDYYKANGISFIERMKENKNFQNPKILSQTVDYFQIDGNGTQFDPVDGLGVCLFVQSVFDPKQYKPVSSFVVSYQSYQGVGVSPFVLRGA